jgi:hypothetical protein
VRVDDVLLGRALVEVLVALRGFVQGDDRGVHGISDVGLVVQNTKKAEAPSGTPARLSIRGGEKLARLRIIEMRDRGGER